MKYELIPAILSHDEEDARKKAKLAAKHVGWIQLDVMDGSFVKQKTWHDAKEARAWPKRLKIELHLMTNDPLAIMKAWKRTPQFARAIWHVESPGDHKKILDWCKKNRIEGGLALNPETPVDALTPYLYHPAFSRAVVLGVRPGKSGQALLASTKKKAAMLRGLLPQMPIEFDGGVSLKNLQTLANHGVTAFAAASAIFGKNDPEAAMAHFLESIRSFGPVSKARGF